MSQLPGWLPCGCRGYCDNYAHDAKLQEMAATLVGKRILSAQVSEESSTAGLVLKLDDGRVCHVGVTGNLHDEAYFLFSF